MEPVIQSFCMDYDENFQEITKFLKKQDINASTAMQLAHLILNRLIFIKFIQEIGFLKNDRNFLINYIKQYRNSGQVDSFYNEWLVKLFFKTLNLIAGEKNQGISYYATKEKSMDLPHVNGGLFYEHEIDSKSIKLKDVLLFNIIENFLEKYNYALSEKHYQTSNGVITPSIFSIIYEGLVSEGKKGKTGIFYTPPTEIDLMCRLGLNEYIMRDKHRVLPKNENISEKIIDFIFTPLEDWDITRNQDYGFLENALKEMKLIDPACGSGAFLIGMYRVLIELFTKLGKKMDVHLKNIILRNNLYGVDINRWALKIVEFRLFLGIFESEKSLSDVKIIPHDFSLNLYYDDSLVMNWKDLFPDIMRNGGFDVIISNPPYVRQEKITRKVPNTKDSEKNVDSNLKMVKRSYKSLLISHVREEFNLPVSKKCDYYVFFFFMALEIANDKGVIVYLTSNSWLDVQFGTFLKQGLLDNARVQLIMVCLSKRTFKNADINTVITVLLKKRNNRPLYGEVNFLSLLKPYIKIDFRDILPKIAFNADIRHENYDYFTTELKILKHADFRIVKLSENDLWKLIKAENDGLNISFNGTWKWGKFLKTPEIYFKIFSEHRDKFIKLGEIANFSYGVKSGANNFFFLGKPGNSNKYFRSQIDTLNGTLLLYLKNDKFRNLFTNVSINENDPIFSIEKEYWMHQVEMDEEILTKIHDLIFEDVAHRKWVPNFYLVGQLFQRENCLEKCSTEPG